MASVLAWVNHVIFSQLANCWPATSKKHNINLSWPYWPTGVMLSFEQPQYSVEESMTLLSVGLMLNRTTSEDVIVEVSVNDGSAKGSSY